MSFGRFVEILNAENVDLLALVGDFSDGTVTELSERVRPFEDLVSGDSKVYVTGNHEYHYPVDGNSTLGAVLWIEFFESIGISSLNNRLLSLPTLNSTFAQTHQCSEAFDLAGVEDWTANPDLEKALSGRNSNHSVVLLAHQPRQIHNSYDLGVDLQLSGHTHGGQLWPIHLGKLCVLCVCARCV